MGGGWLQYLAVFAVSLVLSLVATPLAIRLALGRQILDHPGGHKGHATPVPYLGGLAIVVAFSAAVVGAALLDPNTGGDSELVKVTVIAVALAVMGLIDDVRNLPVIGRLVVEIAAGVTVHAFDLGVSFLPIEWLNGLVTVVWVVGLVNAFNMVDNMDGLAAGLASVTSMSLFAIAVANGQFLVAGLSAALAGCALGFLRSNLFPARVYMGDAGAYFMGFLIAYLGLKLQFARSPENNTFIVPILVCSVVILDATLVSVTRIARGVSPFRGGRDHTSHRLVRLGLPVPVAVGLICVVASITGTVAFVVARVDDVSGWILTGLVAITLVLVGFLLSLIPYRDDPPFGRWQPGSVGGERSD